MCVDIKHIMRRDESRRGFHTYMLASSLLLTDATMKEKYSPQDDLVVTAIYCQFFFVSLTFSILPSVFDEETKTTR